MSDYWLEIQLASFKDATCAIPGVEDATARDAKDGRALKDDIVGKVEFDRARWDAQERDTPTVAQRFEALSNGLSVA